MTIEKKDALITSMKAIVAAPSSRRTALAIGAAIAAAPLLSPSPQPLNPR
jgi:hypothetical protein